MRKRLLSLVMIFGLLSAATACGNYDIADEEMASPQNTKENPFLQLEEDGFLGVITHGGANPNRADDQSILPYEYNGGEFTFAYQFTAEGKLNHIGFLLFLDGKPQAYKTGGTNAEYEYLHCFQAPDKQEETFSFVFTPNMGKNGDTLNMTVISITNPAFRPDMQETASFGWYHKALASVFQLHFNEDAPDGSDIYGEKETVFSNVSVTEEKVTFDFIEKELVKHGYSWNGVTMDNLNDSVYSTISYDGELVYDNINLTNQNTLTVRYTICGTAGMRYGVSFFLNHKPISSESVISYDATLSKGNVWVIEAVIDTSQLDDFNTFYAVAVATDSDSMISADKTDSILLYKEKGR